MSNSPKTPHPKYYFGSAPDLPLDIFQADGPREEQQDNLAAFTLEENITKEKLRDLFKNMAEATKDMGYGMGGSTVNLIAVSGGKIMAANLGDSMTTLFLRKAKGDDLSGHRLSTLHTLRNKTEIERVKPLSDILDVYTNGPHIVKNDGDHSHGTNMTRCLGNTSLHPLIIADPSIHTFEFDSTDYYEAELALYTDGITNTMAHIHSELDHNVEYLATLIDEQRSANPQERLGAAHALGILALQSGLTDNATAFSVDLAALAPEKTLILAVFDGHGPKGREITDAAIAALRNTPDLQ